MAVDIIRTYLKLSFLSSRVTPEPRGIFVEESSYIDQELSAETDSSFMLDGNGDDHLVHIPSQMLMPPKVIVKYEKDQDAKEIASLTSGKEMKSYNGNF